ncbi:hypothetical protein DP163_gp121 [Sea otter poxvirus]|uniref:Uncharacterized protein n=1 Tax=Sea otter poxvirus TaxID=1416741 RepID=A0A2U9QHV5_9POXV|nr:hypothetical protein DP163_gp121 [Sea otter poxvirus]AWU47166.1 hypothetical protein [Sea otter poxvirus]
MKPSIYNTRMDINQSPTDIQDVQYLQEPHLTEEDILNTLLFLEKSRFEIPDILDNLYGSVTIDNNTLHIYKPHQASTRRFLTSCGIFHDDVIVLGKATIKLEKLFLFYMDLAYYGVTEHGTLYKLGRSCKHLSLNNRVFIKRYDDIEAI